MSHLYNGLLGSLETCLNIQTVYIRPQHRKSACSFAATDSLSHLSYASEKHCSDFYCQGAEVGNGCVCIFSPIITLTQVTRGEVDAELTPFTA